MSTKKSAAKPKALPRVRGWVFTLNNYTPADLVHLQAVECKHLVYGCEKAASGTPHVQGYIELENKVGCKALCSLLGGHVHLEPRLGTPAEARDYCLKGEQSHEEWKDKGKLGPNFGKNAITFEKGSPLTPGKRTDIINIRKAALTTSMKELVQDESYNYQDLQIAKMVKQYCTSGRNWITEVIWIWGISGEGKSTLGLEVALSRGYSDPCMKTDGGKFWDNYDGQECVVLDDFRDNWWPMSYNNNMLISKNFRVESKGGSTYFVPKLIIYTSINHPSTYYGGVGNRAEPIAQLLRRITTIAKANVDETSGTFYEVEKTVVNEVPFRWGELINLINDRDLRSGKVIVRPPPATSCPSASMTLPSAASPLFPPLEFSDEEEFVDVLNMSKASAAYAMCCLNCVKTPFQEEDDDDFDGWSTYVNLDNIPEPADVEPSPGDGNPFWGGVTEDGSSDIE